MYIVANRVFSKADDNPYFLRLNRENVCLEIYRKTDRKSLWDKYPVRQDFDASGYTVYALTKTMPCIFGGSGETRTPAGIFTIEKVSRSEYISPYHPTREQVKFFGYLVVFEDYFIHSDMYAMDADIDNFCEKEAVSLQDKHTSGCIRVSQEDLCWLVENIPQGTTIEM